MILVWNQRDRRLVCPSLPFDFRVEKLSNPECANDYAVILVYTAPACGLQDPTGAMTRYQFPVLCESYRTHENPGYMPWPKMTAERALQLLDNMLAERTSCQNPVIVIGSYDVKNLCDAAIRPLRS